MQPELPPVLVLAPPRFIGPLGLMRTLSPWGVKVYATEHVEPSIANVSRFCAGTFHIGRNGQLGDEPDDVILEELLQVGSKLGEGTILVPGSDEWSVFVVRYAHELGRNFRFPDIPLELVEALASKHGLHDLAVRHGLPTPQILLIRNENELGEAATKLTFPVMLKPVVSRPGRQGLELVQQGDDLISRYRTMDDPGNVLCQEYISGSDHDVWIFDGYFDASSTCLAAFTGRKIRQHPAHMGLCTLGVCEQNGQVIGLTEEFLAKVGYRGPVDVGYRWDRRDGLYKVLDINPRLGGAFRLFTDANGLDVARAMYLDMTDRPVPKLVPRDGRKWMLEAGELISYSRYRKDDGLTLRGWLRSLRGLEEGATFSVNDPVPFAMAMRILARDTFGGRIQSARSRLTAGFRRGRRGQARPAQASP